MRKTGWRNLPFREAVTFRGSGSAGLPQKEWTSVGKFPVIGQGVEDIEGWTDRDDLLLTPHPAVVLYGGHTRRVKHVSHPFVAGPNVKILEPTSGLDSKFLYYFVSQLPIESKGYADHFPLVRKFDVPVPPLAEQQRIVRLLDEAFEEIAIAKANTEKNLQNTRLLFESYLREALAHSAVQSEDGIRDQGGAMKSTWRKLPLLDVVSMRPGNNKIIKGKQSDRPGPGLFQAFSASGQDVWVSSADYNQPGIVVSAVGARCGKTFMAHGKWSAIANTHVLLPGEDIDPRWLWYRTNDEAFWIRGGTAQPFVRVRDTLQQPCIIPPLAEQQRIVRSLDQLSRVTGALASAYSNKVVALQQLQASLLDQAFRGELKSA